MEVNDFLSFEVPNKSFRPDEAGSGYTVILEM